MNTAALARILAVTALTLSAHAQSEWAVVSGPGTREDHAMVHDSARGRTVLFGGFDSEGGTWEFDRTAWRLVAHDGPGARWGHAMAYDPLRQRTVLFGGFRYGSSYVGDTWEWDGEVWTEIVTPGPSARWGSAMSFDSNTGTVLLFGGSTGGDETWSFDGTTWTLLGTQGPSARTSHSMVLDAQRDRVVLFGGSESSFVIHDDTWEWDGVAWTQKVVTGPAGRVDHAMTFDPSTQRVLLQGGDTFTVSAPGFRDTWSWDGANWQLEDSDGPELKRARIAFDTVRNRVLLLGGIRDLNGGGQVHSNRTLEWNGAEWVTAMPELDGPYTLYRHAMVYDPVRERTIVFGGIDDNGGLRDETWEWDGFRWSLVATTGPSARFGHVMAYDSDRDVIVMYGGSDGVGLLDTWEWNGQAWNQVTTNHPGTRLYSSMEYDPISQRMILFGTRIFPDIFANTWTFDGQTWTQLAVNGPLGRYGATMTRDPSGGLVLFGGYDGDFTPMGDTWVWDGQSWSQPLVTGPVPRAFCRMVYDPTRNRAVLFGGQVSIATIFEDAWEWNGAVWNQVLQTGTVPPGRGTFGMAFDIARDRIVLFGGEDPLGLNKEQGRTWEWPQANDAATDRYLGVGCIGTADRPCLTTTGPTPRLGTTWSCRLERAPASGVPALDLAFALLDLGVPIAPIPLDLIGMDGCELRVANADFTIVVPTSNGQGDWSIPLPDDASLAGTPFAHQVVALDANANAFGLTTSNTLAGTFGY